MATEMTKNQIRALLKLPLPALAAMAGRVMKANGIRRVELCNIMNAKSGFCGEDCKFCAQSARHRADIMRYPLKSKAEMLEAARRARAIGAHRFDIVTSGGTLSVDELEVITGAVSEIRDKVGIDMCASLGKLGRRELLALKKAGVSRYHHNIETSPRYYGKIVTTHTFRERLDTIRAAKSAGLEVCSGGIIGMGENWDDRIDMARILKRLDVDSVPINILVPIKGTPLGSLRPLPAADTIRAIAIFRIILGGKVIKVAAGRESVLKELQAMAFMAGANGMLIGGYLTIKGDDVSADRRLAKEVETAWAK